MTAPVSLEEATFERVWLDECSWVDVARHWVPDADEVYQTILERARWRESKLWRYDHWFVEPRLGTSWHVGEAAPHDAIPELTRKLQTRYRVPFDGAAIIWYRDGRDSVAFHRDRELRWLENTVIAVVSLGQRRPWLLRPRRNRFEHSAPNRGATHDLAPGRGDLLVMGGRCQTDWEHSVPKVHHSIGGRPIGGRIALQWRWTSRQGRPERGPSYRAPRNYNG